MLRIVFFIVLACWLPTLASAETVYVNDSLRVGVRTEPGNSMVPHGVVTTGMQLEVLERSDGYVKIRNEAGLAGWIKDIYITSEKPAKLELARLAEEHAKLQAKLAKQGDLDKAASARTAALTAEIAALNTTNAELNEQLAQTSSSESINMTLRFGSLLVLVLVATAIGFVGGVNWYRRQAMRRLGGLRV